MRPSEPMTAQFDRLARRHQGAVLRQMVRACGNRDDAEDALMEALLAAHRSLGRLRDPDAFGSWLARVAHRACARIRNRGALEPLLIADGFEPGTEPPPAHETKMCIEEAIAALPDGLREAFLLRDVEGLSAEEAARRLGVSVPALKSRLHRARERLREALDQSLCLRQ